MANLKDIQRKIKSVNNTQKTTRAMKLVSTAKLRKAEELAKKSRLYAQKLNQVIAEITKRIQCNKVGGIDNRCFLEIQNPKTIDIIFITADKGLCGGFNIQTIKAVKDLINKYKSKDVKIRLRGIGKKGVEYFKFNEVELSDVVVDLSSRPDKSRSDSFIATSLNDFKDGKTDAVYLVYNGYKNMITQELHSFRVLPASLSPIDCEDTKKSIIEIEAQDEEKMLNDLVSRYAEYTLYYSLIDSSAAEHSSRMQAMDAATNNAKEMVRTLNVSYNKARQAAITTELIEIISGVESMK
ncbi:MAG: ATP synthase F1 subunit gamma [Sulfurimonas sp.]|jgi:F-type H+-transporting ATPase subunit gamma|nr:ATP synthase F1 subunit gamma [Sulfurimonadaceae bacterium]